MADTGPGVQPESDIYTVLVMVATVFLLIGTVFVCVRANQIYGNWLPFTF